MLDAGCWLHQNSLHFIWDFFFVRYRINGNFDEGRVLGQEFTVQQLYGGEQHVMKCIDGGMI